MFENSIHGFLELKEKHLTQRINSCDLLKKRNENDPFLKRLITGDEKMGCLQQYQAEKIVEQAT